MQHLPPGKVPQTSHWKQTGHAQEQQFHGPLSQTRQQYHHKGTLVASEATNPQEGPAISNIRGDSDPRVETPMVTETPQEATTHLAEATLRGASHQKETQEESHPTEEVPPNGNPGGNPPDGNGPPGGYSPPDDRYPSRPYRPPGGGPPDGGPPGGPGGHNDIDEGGSILSFNTNYIRRATPHGFLPDGNSMYERKMSTDLSLLGFPKPWQWKEWVIHLTSELCRMVCPRGTLVMQWLGEAEDIDNVPEEALKFSGSFPRLDLILATEIFRNAKAGCPELAIRMKHLQEARVSNRSIAKVESFTGCVYCIP